MSKNKLVLNKVPIVIKKKSSFSINQHIFRNTTIYDSKEMNFFKEKYQRVTLFNRQNILNNSCRLIAKIETLNGETLEKTSDEIVKMIGQEEFEVLFMALCSIINQEIRIRGLLSILTVNKPEKSVQNDVQMKKIDAWCQTDETRLAKVNVNRKRRMRRHLAPYVIHDFKVPEKVKKIIVDIPNYSTSTSNSHNESNYRRSTSNSSNELKEMPDLGYLHDDNSSTTSISTIPDRLHPNFDSEIVTNPMKVLKTIDEHTNKEFNVNHEDSMKNLNNGLTKETVENGFNLILSDKTSIMLPKKPEDHFHIATVENLKDLDSNTRKKLIEIQRIIDLKYCMTPTDDEGNLPIHMAVLNEDLLLLKRQCFIFNLKEISVDIEANGLTPLKLSLFKQSVSATSLLLTFGADPLWLDDTHSTYFHTAAELDTEHLTVLLQYCSNNVRSLISENEDLQLPGWKEKSDDELSSYLMDHICSICDSQGYTPLMLATTLGLYNHVRSLLARSPTTVNAVNPTTGNTALYLAVIAACNVAAERGNKSKLVDHFQKTIEILLDYGADPTIDNYSGSNISVLLTDFQCPELSTLIANRGPASKYNNNTKNNNYNSLIFYKDDVTKVKYSIDNNKTIQLKNFRKIKEKPVILDSIVLSKNQSDSVIKIESDSIKYHGDSTDSDVMKTENNLVQNHNDRTENQIDLTKKHSIIIKSKSDLNHNDSNLNHADSIKTYSKMESDSIKIIQTNSMKFHSNSTESGKKPKLIQLKKPSLSTKNISESNEKSIKVSSNNIIVNKPDKIILTSVNLMEFDKSNNSFKRIDSSIEKTDSSIDPIKNIDPAVIIESISNIKANTSQNSKSITARNITLSDFDANTESNKLPSAVRFLQSIVGSINRESCSVPESLTVTKVKPNVYVKKSIPNTKKSIKKKIDNGCEVEAPLKTNKRKLSDID